MKKVLQKLFFVVLFMVTSQVISQNISKNMTRHFDQLLEQNDLLTNDVQYIINTENVSRTSNVSHIYFTQTINGIEVYGTTSSIMFCQMEKQLLQIIYLLRIVLKEQMEFLLLQFRQLER